MYIRSASDMGSMVRSKRKQLGLSQAQLAEFCGCGTRFISDLENGKPTVQIEKVFDVVAMLSLDVRVTDRLHGGDVL